MTECEQHDWRVNPHITLTSFPARWELVCALCGAKASVGIPDRPPLKNDPATWPKWAGGPA